MLDRLKLGAIVTAMGLLMAAPLASPAHQAAGQDVTGRFRVLVPNFEPLNDARDKYGKETAKELRKLINDLATHQPVDEKELKSALKQYDIDEDDLNCIRARQLANLMNVEVVVCSSYAEEGGEKQFRVNSQFVTVSTGETFEVPSFVGIEEKESYKEGAAQIASAFERLAQQTRAMQFCADYAQSQQWQNSLENCDRAIDLNPSSSSARMVRARVLRETDRMDESLVEYEEVLKLDPMNETALQSAGYVAAQLGEDDKARKYYADYLELDPMNSGVRMKVAYDLAQAGDPAGAMGLLEEGLEIDPENADLWQQYGNFAFAAGSQAFQASGAAQDSELPPEVEQNYRTAIDAYQRVFAVQGADMNPAQLRNIVAMYAQLGELDEAIRFGDEALAAHPDDAALWSTYANAKQQTGDLEGAIAALEKVRELDPEAPNVSARQGKWLLDAGRNDEALPVLKDAVTRGEQTADAMARLVFADAYSNGIQKNNFDYGINGIAAAKSFDGISSGLQSQLNFFHGYGLYKKGEAAQGPQTLASAQATLPVFQQALRQLQGAGEYAAATPSVNLQQFLDATNQYIEIQEAIIKRGR
jgi:tetratricopeptide (TPR) repeat protein